MVPAPAVSATESAPPRRQSVGGWAFSWGAVLLLVVGYLTYLFLGIGGADFETADAARVKERQKILADRVAEDQKMLHDKPSWFSKEKGLVRVPIERAMSMTVTELSQVQPHPAYPISQSPPQPASALALYGSLAPGKSTKAASTLPAGAQPAGSPAPAPASALPSATPAASSPDAAVSISKSSPAPAPLLVAPPTPGPVPAASPAPNAVAPPVPAASAAPTVTEPAPSPAATTPAASPGATP
jgi:hypothetical protein